MWSSFADAVLGFFEGVLTFLHNMVEPVFGVHSWGWAIILLTLIVRVFLLPLAIKQTRSMRGMQAIQPQMKEIQKKYKVDRELMRKDPEKYRAKKQKMNEEMMALYQQEGVNPAASCLPLLAQAPVFIALFWTIRGMDELADAPFYFFTDFIQPGADGFTGLGALVSTAGWPGWLLIVVMSGTMFVTQKQMMARTAATGQDNPMAQQQKILLYVMPAFLAVISFQFALGLLLYWVTTNIWQVVQQWIILREVQGEAKGKGKDEDGGSGPARSNPSAPGKGGATSGRGKSTGATSGKPKHDDGKDTASKKQEPQGEAGKGPKDPKAKGAQDAKKAEQEPSGDDAPQRNDGGQNGNAGQGPTAADAGPSAKDAGGAGNGGGAKNNGASPKDAAKEPQGGRPSSRDHLPRRGGKRS